jgi:hypothetical protein
MGIAPLQTQLSFVFRGFCLILPPLSLLASHGVVALLMITAALAGLVVWRAERRLPLPDRALSLAFAALVIWCAIASFWGFTVTQSLVLALRIGAIFAAALVTFAIVRRLDAGVRDGLGAWLLAGILISAMAMMMWPAAALLWRRGAVAASLVFLAGAGAILSSLASGAAILGVAAGGATAILALLHRKAGRLVLRARRLRPRRCIAAIGRMPTGWSPRPNTGSRSGITWPN